jgi:putative oxidoreductase
LQRLFSMFPNGWPGRALLLLRLSAGAILIYDGITGLLGPNHVDVIVQDAISVVAGLLLVLGLWTPIAGAVVAVLELWSIAVGTDHIRGAVLLAALGAALAMLGPGVRSIDARLFGRRRLDIPEL